MNINRRQFLLGSGAMAMAALLPAPSSLAADGSSQPALTGLTAKVRDFDLGDGKAFKAWSFNDAIPGPVIRARLGDTIRLKFTNKLPEPSTIHWHGLPVPNPMDGVPGVTQKAVQPGGSFLYEFPAKPAGTYFYHSHKGLQLDRGLYGALVIDDPDEAQDYDQEFVLVLEDWGGQGRRWSAGRPA